MTITLVSCIDLNNAIGNNGDLLIKLPNDMKHFKQLTTSGDHNVCVMGRRTHQSIGKTLSERINIVLTKDKKYKAIGCHVYHSVEDVLREYKNYGGNNVKLWVCGGTEVYKAFLPYADVVELTIVNYKFPKADAFFPRLSDDWRVVSHVKFDADEKHPFKYSFVTYEKK